jgi:hypothetical protein
MVSTTSLVLQLIAVGLIAYGYTKKNRNFMLAGAVVLWLGAGWSDFVRGFIDGFRS